MCGVAAADEKRIVLIEGKFAAAIRPLQDSGVTRIANITY